jgi:hypothetical protein
VALYSIKIVSEMTTWVPLEGDSALQRRMRGELERGGGDSPFLVSLEVIRFLIDFTTSRKKKLIKGFKGN